MSTHKARTQASISKKLLFTSALTAAGIMAMTASPAHAIDPNTTPQGGNITGGQGTINQSGLNTDIHQDSQNLWIDWQSFSHGKNATTQFHQPNSKAWALNRVVGNIDGALGTVLDGKILANGNVGVFDQNGVIFGPNARIDTNSFVASTGRLNRDVFDQTGVMEISDFGAGSIELQEGATVTVAEAGLAAFVSPKVVNAGIINAKMGTVALAAGEKATIDLYGDGLYEIAVEGELADALLENTGEINAEGGKVQMTALAAKGAVENIINVEGLVNVASVTQEGGKIILDGGDKGIVSVSGTLDASGATGGGEITVAGENTVIAETAQLNADATVNGDGGDILVWGDNAAILAGEATARGGAEGGNGGFIELSAGDTVGFNGTVSTQAPNGDVGRFLIDPENINIGNYSSAATAAQLLVDAIFGNLNLLTIDQQSLANALYGSDVDLWATNTINTTADIDLSVAEVRTGTYYGGFGSGCLLGCAIYTDYITDNNLTLSAPTVNINNDITIGAGTLSIVDLPAGSSPLGYGLIDAPTDIIVDTVNLNGKIYSRSDVLDPAFTTLASSGQLIGQAHTVNVSTDASINQGIQFADGSLIGGADVNLADGTYNENVIIDRSLNLNGTGTDATTIIDGTGLDGHGITVAADNVSLNGMIIQNFNGAYYYASGIGVETDVAGLSMNDIDSRNNKFAGFYVSNEASVDGLDVDDSHFDNNVFGWYLEKGDNNVANLSTVTNVTVDGTTFNNNTRKGIYAEKLDRATFTDVDVIDSGTDLANPFGNAGIDINLKNGTYTDITFDNLTVSGSGLNTPATTGNAVAVKARNDGATYGATPATLTNLTIKNSDITAGGDVAVAIGYGVNGAYVTDNTNITGPEAVLFYGGVQNAEATGNTITSTGLSARGRAYGIAFVDTITGKAINNDITGSYVGAGILANNSSDITIGGADFDTDENIVRYFKNGIQVTGSTGTTLIQNNSVTGNKDSASNRAVSDWTTGIGIFVDNSTGTITIADNQAGDNTDGIRVRNTDGAVVEGNHAFLNEDKGIISKFSDDVEIKENTVTGNDIGVYVDGGDRNLIQANLIENNTQDGIHLRDSDDTDIRNNWIHGNADGVEVEGASTGTIIYDNSFAEDDGSEINGTNIRNTSGSLVNASFNWFGSTDEVAVASKIVGSVDISPYQGEGIDTQPGTPGYQGNAGNLYVTTLGAQTSGLIQEAIDAATAGGDVNVNAGTYTENLLINKALKLTGLPGATLNYDVANSGSGTAGNLITVTADNVNIDPFVFNGGGVANYGINATGADNLVIDGNTFLGFVLNSINLSDSNNVRIFGNDITGGQKGIFGNDVTNIQIFENEINDATVAGIHITNSPGTGYDGGGNDVDIWSNEINSAASATAGVWVQNSAYATVGWHPTNPFATALTGGNTITGGVNGILVENSANTYVAHNSVSDTNWDGIGVWSSNGAQILSNVITNAGESGIALGGSANSKIEDNEINNSDAFGIYSSGNNDVQILTNDINGTGADGIIHFGAEDATISGNTVDDTDAGRDGIRVENVSGVNNITGNTVTNAGWNGITNYLQNGGTVNISGNHVFDSNWDGIQVAGGTGWVNVELNDVHNTLGASGIAVLNYGGDGVVDGNTVDGADRMGIYFDNTDGFEITGNTVHDTGREGNPNFLSGIVLENSNNTLIDSNTIWNTAGDGIQIGGQINFAPVDTTGNTVSNNVIGYTDFAHTTTAGDNNIARNGIQVQDSNGAQVTGNWIIDAAGNGIYNNSSDNTTISGNNIQSVDLAGILVNPSTGVDIIGNTVNGAQLGIFLKDSSETLVVDNTLSNIDEDGIYVRNHDGNLTIVDNTIGADNHGIYFDDGIGAGDVVTINGNDISANEDNGLTGSGIFFNGSIVNGTITIGNGTGASLATGASNTIVVAQNAGPGGQSNLDGIHFNKIVDGAAKIAIDGNRIGYNSVFAQNAVADDGIEFRGGVAGDADIDITDNFIASLNDGIEFSGVAGKANVLIGGDLTGPDGNMIDANSNGTVGHGILFNGPVGGEALVEISYNGIDADQDGIHFAAAVSNAVNPGSHTNELIIAHNTIWGRDSGVNFNFTVSGENHDTLITDNTITGLNNDGVRFGGTVDDAEIRIVDNTSITGGDDGVSFVGPVVNEALIEITDNTSIEGNSDGVNFDQTVTGSTVRINGNDNIVALSGNGVNFAGGIDTSTVEIIGNNDGISANDHGIYVAGNVIGSTIDIHGNIIDANTDNDGTGSGIWFNGTIETSTINIGNGFDENDIANSSAPSNVIAVGGSGANVDGIRFFGNVGDGANITIDGNRIGYTGTPGNQGSIVADGAGIADEGIQFGTVNGTSNVTITDNSILSVNNGVEFGAISGEANILIGGTNDRNTVNAGANGILFASTVSGESQIAIENNNIEANDDGILFNGVTSNAVLPAGTSQQEIFIDSNIITGGDNGIRFAQNVATDLHDIRITNNDITGQSAHGIHFAGNIGAESQVWILNNTNIEGYNDGIHVEGTVSGEALVEIVDNAHIEGLHDDAIDFNGNINGDAVVRINSNDSIRADNTAGTNADNGIEFAGVNGGTVEILENNHGIHANDHGIYFGGAINGGAVIDIHDNIITADEDDFDGTEGAGIYFNGTINDATISIGDGSGATLNSDPSNVIDAYHGIVFANTIGSGTTLVIDGNRLGYETPSLADPLSNERLDGHGIQFAAINGDADVDVEDNWIRADGDGIKFNGEIYGDANVLIGGAGDKNTINANGDGIQFHQNIYGNSRISIDSNDIDADENGIEFNGSTGNEDNTFPYSEQEINISNNDIVGGENGIIFYGTAYGDRHDINIQGNSIVGNGGDGIAHVGNINNATLWIQDNDYIYGSRDGVHIEGAFYNDAQIIIADNSDVDSGSGDGIEVTDTGASAWGANVEITGNHVHHTGDNGIEVSRVNGVLIDGNEVHDTDADGINVTDSEYADITWNEVYDTDGDGIDVNNSAFAYISFNRIYDIGDAFGEDHGIELTDSFGSDIYFNTISDVNDNGIDVDNSAFTDVIGNFIAGIDNNGIEVSDSFGANINWNWISFVGDNGIEVDNSAFSDVNNNLITFAGEDGINVDNSFGVDINENFIRFVARDGIDVDDSAFADVNNNNIAFVGDNGIEISDSAFADVNDNTISFTGDDGIEIRYSFAADVNGNTITTTGGDGIDVEYSAYVDVNGNTVTDASDNGIEVQGSDNADINGNTVTGSGLNGIYVNPSDDVTISGNIISGSAIDGIYVTSGNNLTVSGNTVSGSGNDNVEINNTTGTIIVSGNTLNNAGTNGLNVSGTNNGYVEVYGNTINNPVNLASFSGPNGMNFESGTIDLTGPGNTIIGGRVGLRFNAQGPLTLTKDPSDPALFEGTIGAQTITNPSQFFVEVVGNGSLFGPGPGPHIWNAQNSTYTYNGTTVTPSATGGVLTQAQFDLLEDGFFHFPDGLSIGQDLGLFFFGFVPANGVIISQEDIFNQFDGVIGNPSGLNIRFVNNNAALFAGIAPNAGEEEEEGTTEPQNIEPAAGNEQPQQNPQDIEPEAGDEENVSCWGDAVSASAGGGNVTYSFGGSFEDSLSGAASCNSGVF